MKLDAIIRNVLVTAVGVIVAGVIINAAPTMPIIKQARDGLR